MSKRLPLVALVSYPHFSPFHFGVPFLIFSAQLPEQALFDLKIVTPGGTALAAERALFVQPDGGLELLAKADIVVIPGWHDLAERPEPELIAALRQARQRVPMWWGCATARMSSPMRACWMANAHPHTGWRSRISSCAFRKCNWT